MRHFFLMMLGVVGALTYAVSSYADDTEYQQFNEFCIQYFGAESEPLMYEAFGEELREVDSALWRHVSENSAAIGFATNLPAVTYVEYGIDTSYGQMTEATERPFTQHLHIISDLETGMSYHYRWVATDERGNTVVSEDRIFTTESTPGAIRIPGDLSGPPYVLDQAGATYVLDTNIVSDTRGITIAATDVTLDLNGHTISYDNGEPVVQGAWNDYLYSDVSSFGVYVNPNCRANVFNGHITQGASQSEGDIGIGFNPIIVRGGPSQIAGVVASYGGASVSGLILRGGTNEIHHNVVIDYGTEIVNRSQGVRAVMCTNNNESVHHNLIKRTRQQGIMNAGPVYSNEVYIDSWATNSMGVGPTANQVIEDNRIFGTGYHAVAFGWALVDECDFVVFRNNFAFLQGDAPTNRSPEYGTHSSVNGMRLTQYDGSARQYNNYLYEDNYIIAKGMNGCDIVRGVQFFSDPWIRNLQFRNNTIKTEIMDSATEALAACVVAQGVPERHDEQLPVLYKDNRLISNSNLIMFGDNYGNGGNHHFQNCELERFGNRADFVTIDIGYWWWPSYNNSFTDCTLMGGASLDDHDFTGNDDAHLAYSYGHALHVQAITPTGTPITGSTIQVVAENGVLYETTTDENGVGRLELYARTYSAPPGQSEPNTIDHSGHGVLIPGHETVYLTAGQMEIRDNAGNPLQLIFAGDGVELPGQPSGLVFQEN